MQYMLERKSLVFITSSQSVDTATGGPNRFATNKDNDHKTLLA